MIVDINVALHHPLYPKESRPEALLSMLKGDGVDRACVTSWEPYATYNFMAGNDRTAEAVKKSGGRWIGWGAVNPFQRGEADRCVEELGFRGLRLAPNYIWYYPSQDSDYVAVCAARAQVPLHVAVTPERPTNFRQVAEFAEGNPTLPVIMGQLWIPYFWPAATVLAVKYPNIYLELGMTCTKMLEDALAKIGPEKVLFGSGAPVQRPFAVIQHVRGLKLSRADQDLILGGNAERLLRLDGQEETPSRRPRAGRKVRGARPPAASKASRRPAMSRKRPRGGRP